MARTVGMTVAFDWSLTGTYVDETARLVSADGELRFHPPGEHITAGSGIIDRCTIELHNASGRYSPFLTTGGLYAYTQNGGAYHVGVRVEATIDGSTYYRIFTGVAKVPRETGRRFGDIPTVAFECRSVDELYLQRRYSSGAQYTATRHEEGYTDAQIIDAYLTAGGVTGQQVDTGIVSIPWSYMDAESIIEEAWAVAAASAGRLYADYNGVMRYESMAHWLTSPHATSQQTYTADDWQSCEARYDDRNLYNSVTVEYAPRQVSGDTLLYEPDEVITVPANSSKTIIAVYQYPTYTVPELTWHAHTAGGRNMTADVTVTPTYYAQRATLVIANTHATLSTRISGLKLTGRAIIGAPSGEVVRTSAEHGSNGSFWTARATNRDRRISGNFYIQSRAQATTLAQMLLDRLERPHVTYSLRGAPGNPQRRPGDRITINDASMMSAAREAMVLAVSWRYGDGAFVQDIEAIDAAALYPYLGTTPGYFVIGTNKLGTADALRGRVFY